MNVESFVTIAKYPNQMQKYARSLQFFLLWSITDIPEISLKGEIAAVCHESFLTRCRSIIILINITLKRC